MFYLTTHSTHFVYGYIWCQMIWNKLVQVDWKPGPTEITPNWASCPILQTLEPGPTKFVPNWAMCPILQTLEPGPTKFVPNWAMCPILQTLVQGDWEPGPTEIVPNWAPHLLRPTLYINISHVIKSGLRKYLP